MPRRAKELPEEERSDESFDFDDRSEDERLEPEEDEEIDSDEALGESDEERFSGYVFRGSHHNGERSKKAKISHFSDDDDELHHMKPSKKRTQTQTPGRERHQDPGSSSPVHLPEDAGGEVDEDGQSILSDSDNGNNERDAGGKAISSNSDEDDDRMTDANMDRDSSASRLYQNVSSLYNKQATSTKIKGSTDNHHTAPTPKLSIQDILETIHDKSLSSSISQLSTKGKKGGKSIPGKLAAPLPRTKQDRMERIEAYNHSKQSVNRWTDTVKKIREADRIIFPIADNTSQAKAPSSLSKASNPNSMTELEKQISNVLGEQPDSRKLSSLTLEGAGTQEVSKEAQHAQLRMAREILHREEVRAKRLKKIKSKGYRRILKRERLKAESIANDSRDIEEVRGEDVAETVIRERMTLRHQQSKWAQNLRNHGHLKWNESAKQDRMAMAEEAEKLRHRIVGTDQKDNADFSDDESDGEYTTDALLEALEKTKSLGYNDSNGKPRGVLAMKFMQSIADNYKSENDRLHEEIRREITGENNESDEVTDVRQTGRRKFVTSNVPEASSEVIRSRQLRHDENFTNSSRNSAINLTSTNEEITRSEDVNPWLALNSGSESQHSKDLQRSAITIEIDAHDHLAKSAANSDADNATYSNNSAGSASRVTTSHDSNCISQVELVKRAFAGDDVVQEFSSMDVDDFEETTTRHDAQDKHAPGWGSWAVSAKKKKRKQAKNPMRSEVAGSKSRLQESAKDSSRQNLKSSLPISGVVINQRIVKKVCEILSSVEQ